MCQLDQGAFDITCFGVHSKSQQLGRLCRETCSRLKQIVPVLGVTAGTHRRQLHRRRTGLLLLLLLLVLQVLSKFLNCFSGAHRWWYLSGSREERRSRSRNNLLLCLLLLLLLRNLVRLVNKPVWSGRCWYHDRCSQSGRETTTSTHTTVGRTWVHLIHLMLVVLQLLLLLLLLERQKSHRHVQRAVFKVFPQVGLGLKRQFAARNRTCPVRALVARRRNTACQSGKLQGLLSLRLRLQRNL
jgi:hypothetical protein